MGTLDIYRKHYRQLNPRDLNFGKETPGGNSRHQTYGRMQPPYLFITLVVHRKEALV